ncbi:MAG: hypothetical protein J6A07_02080 [Firmicutes bacterium]|nr:hypothetical protein [Bacillota bacterium]
MPRLTKQQKEYRKMMKQLKKEGKVRDEYGQVVEPEKFHIDLSVVVKVLISLYLVYVVMTNFTALGMMIKSFFMGEDAYTEDFAPEYEAIEEDEMIYTFEKAEPDHLSSGARILSVYPDGDQLDHSKFMGQAITLFGQPDRIENDYEDMFETGVKAKDKDGNKIYLYIYHGPSGPAIGGSSDEQSKRAADELASLIENAEPTDYDWEGVYEDLDITIKMGVKNGVPYYEDNSGEVFG